MSVYSSPPAHLLASWGAVRSEEVDVLLVSPGGQTKMKNLAKIFLKKTPATFIFFYIFAFFNCEASTFCQ